MALVHPLVQVYSVPSTGELAYVGHVCNFRQRVAKFLSSLPTLPVDMPFVLVRPRRSTGKKMRGRGAPHAVHLQRLRKAFALLQRHISYFREVLWEDGNAAAWESREYESPGREEDLPSNIVIIAAEFHALMTQAAVDEESGNAVNSVGRKLRDWLLTQEAEADLWNSFRHVLSEKLEKNFFRVAATVNQDEVT